MRPALFFAVIIGTGFLIGCGARPAESPYSGGYRDIKKNADITYSVSPPEVTIVKPASRPARVRRDEELDYLVRLTPAKGRELPTWLIIRAVDGRGSIAAESRTNPTTIGDNVYEFEGTLKPPSSPGRYNVQVVCQDVFDEGPGKPGKVVKTVSASIQLIVD